LSHLAQLSSLSYRARNLFSGYRYNFEATAT
jgi:hypothetical protein